MYTDSVPQSATPATSSIPRFVFLPQQPPPLAASTASSSLASASLFSTTDTSHTSSVRKGSSSSSSSNFGSSPHKFGMNNNDGGNKVTNNECHNSSYSLENDKHYHQSSSAVKNISGYCGSPKRINPQVSSAPYGHSNELTRPQTTGNKDLSRVSFLPLSSAISSVPLATNSEYNRNSNGTILYNRNRAKSLPSSKLIDLVAIGNQTTAVPAAVMSQNRRKPDSTGGLSDFSYSNTNLPTALDVKSVQVDHNQPHFKSLSFQSNLEQQQQLGGKFTAITPLSRMKLIKSQSLRFDSPGITTATSAQCNNFATTTTNTATSSIAHRPQKIAKLEASKSLDTVDQVVKNYGGGGGLSRLPRSQTVAGSRLISARATTQSIGENFFNICLVEKMENLSHSSTASLGLLTNLADSHECSGDGDCGDMPIDSDDEYMMDLGARLTAIDESLSPLVSLDLPPPQQPPINQPNQPSSVDDNQFGDEPALPPPPQAVLNQFEPPVMNGGKQDDGEESTPVSLNSIEIDEVTVNNTEDKQEPAPPSQQQQSTKKQCRESIEQRQMINDLNGNNAKAKARDSTADNKSDNSSAQLKPRSTAAATTTTVKSATLTRKSFARPTTTTATGSKCSVLPNRLAKPKVVSKVNSKSSLPTSSSSASVSRASTPASTIDGDLGEPISLSSTTSTASIRSNRTTTSQTSKTGPLARMVQRVPLRNVDSRANNKHSTVKSGLSTMTRVSNESIKRSSTYTRSLNKAPATTVDSRKIERKENVPINKQQPKSSIGAGPKTHSFAKPTASYLKKTSSITTAGQRAAPSVPKRPSSVASNSSTASTASSVATKKNVPSTLRATAKRSPTITLLSAAATSPSASKASSRRSSINSPTTKTGTITKKDDPDQLHHQVKQLELHIGQKNELIRAAESSLVNSQRQSQALFVLFAFLINEYSPFDNPKLRAELATLHQRCCNLHRDHELSKEVLLQKDAELEAFKEQLTDLSKCNAELTELVSSLQTQLDCAREEFEYCSKERTQLELTLEDSKTEAKKEKDGRIAAETRVEQLESSLRSDKKYRELREKISNFEKEVDSLNVVVDMKTQRIRQLEGDKMRSEIELADYESLKESYQRLQRENEALTETLGMKARKNAEQSREIDTLRSELKREVNEKKRMSIKYDQLEYQFNESRELLSELYSSTIPPINESDSDQDSLAGGDNPGGESSFRFTPFTPHSSSRRNPAHTSNRTSVRRLFSTPAVLDSQQQRQHFQHQDPAFNKGSAQNNHRLPELVLSSIGATNWMSQGKPQGSKNQPPPQPPTHHPHSHHHHNHRAHEDTGHATSAASSSPANSSPMLSPKIITDKKGTAQFEYPAVSTS